MGATSFFLVCGLGLGFYDGFFGAGTGSFWTIAQVAVMGFTFARATGPLSQHADLQRPRGGQFAGAAKRVLPVRGETTRDGGAAHFRIAHTFGELLQNNSPH